MSFAQGEIIIYSVFISRKGGLLSCGGHQVENPLGDIDMEPFNHDAINLDDTFIRIFQAIKDSDDLTREFNFFRAWRKNLIYGRNLAGVDQHLTIKAHISTLLRFQLQSFFIIEIIIDAINNFDIVNACGQNARRKPRQQGRAARGQTRA